MKIVNSKSLVQNNTFKIDVNTKFFVDITSESDLLNLLQETRFKNIKKLILGGGSNILLTKNINGLTIHNQIKGINIKKETDKYIFVSVGAGEVWDDLVVWTTKKKLYGIENLSLIPGYVGAAPIQNIGAYGVEFIDVFEELRGVDLTTNKMKILTKNDCEFGYRDSIFKHKLKNKFIITEITIKLSKIKKLKTSYISLSKELKKLKKDNITSQTIREIIIDIRNEKLPNPNFIGNAGSFFKNPIITKQTLIKIKKLYPDVPVFEKGKEIKISAAWLIEKTNWKGYRIGECGVYNKHALILINYGKAVGKDIINLSIKIKATVKKKFNINLEEEVTIL